MPSVFIVGVDPGIHGAVSIIRQDRVDVWDMPTVTTVKGKRKACFVDPAGISQIFEACALSTNDDVHCIVERVRSRPTDGVASSFKFGYGYGVVHGLAHAYFERVVEVPPAVWKRSLGLTADKQGSLDLAQAHWPFQKDLFKLKKHADRAEASLLAMYYHDFVLTQEK
jgi:crossover junction endodeoxyribonuclease RuvC